MATATQRRNTISEPPRRRRRTPVEKWGEEMETRLRAQLEANPKLRLLRARFLEPSRSSTARKLWHHLLVYRQGGEIHAAVYMEMEHTRESLERLRAERRAMGLDPEPPPPVLFCGFLEAAGRRQLGVD